MNRIPLADIVNIAVGDMLTGQDGNKYVVCDEAGVTYWKPVITIKTHVPKPVKKVKEVKENNPVSKPIKKVKEVKEKFYWKDNDKKPKFEHEGDNDEWYKMAKSLIPKVSPSKFPAGYVWTTKFCNISYVVDIEYVDYSTTSSKFWHLVYSCSPCIDAEDYPIKHMSGDYCVDYDEQGNKFWSHCLTSRKSSHQPLQFPRKFPEGTTRTGRDGDTYVSRRDGDYDTLWGDAYWTEE